MMNRSIKMFAENLISKIPHIGKWRSAFLKHSIPGHYYSPIPDLVYVQEKGEIIFDRSIRQIGINLNAENQFQILQSIGIKEYIEFNHFISNSNNLYNPDNIYYRYHDVVSLFSIMRFYKPKIIIEIGCGFSSAAMIDINRFYFNNEIFFKFIEPYPENRLNQVLANCQCKSFKLFQKHIQDIDLREFEELECNDILFVDSSHVSKVGSDLNHILFNILPRLKRGVIIHFHDIHYPFEYPEEWVKQGYSWNENYLLRALLTNNNDYEVIFMNSFLNATDSKFYHSLLNATSYYSHNEAGSIFIKKI